jgi:hypothetical protein
VIQYVTLAVYLPALVAAGLLLWRGWKWAGWVAWWIGVAALTVANVASWGWGWGLLSMAPIVVTWVLTRRWRNKRRRAIDERLRQHRVWLDGEEITGLIVPESVRFDPAAVARFYQLSDTSITIQGVFDAAAVPPRLLPPGSDPPCRAYGACGATTRAECTCEEP